MTDFIAGLPKCELHVHLEGTLERGMRRALAERHGLPAPEPEVAAEATTSSAGTSDAVSSEVGEYGTLASFLKSYYEGMSVLREEQDFADLTGAYLQKAHDQRVVYCEMFFDPQAHTTRNVPFDAVIRGIRRAQVHAERSLGIRSRLILCFLRDESAESAMATLEASLRYKEWILGVGLDSDERGNPPSKFTEVFRRARAEGYRVTMHCDPNQDGSLRHLRECLDLIGVERIDHGVNCMEDEAIWTEIRRRGLGLTVCPLSNRWIYGDLMADAVAKMLDVGLLVTCNSDDPAYFGGYMDENLRALGSSGKLTREQIVQLVRNAFEVSWLSPEERDGYRRSVDEYVRANG